MTTYFDLSEINFIRTPLESALIIIVLIFKLSWRVMFLCLLGLSLAIILLNRDHRLGRNTTSTLADTAGGMTLGGVSG